MAGSRNAVLPRGALDGKVLFLDAMTAGMAGDMTLAALLDLGVPLDVVRTGLDALKLGDFDLNVTQRSHSGIVAPYFSVVESKDPVFRDWRAIKRIIGDGVQRGGALTPGAAMLALDAFGKLAVAEAACHGLPVDDVHFHEVGAVDSIVDIVGVAIAVDYLAPREIWVSPLPMGRGIIRGAAHGPLPSPPPATVGVLAGSGIPTFDAGVDGEFVTPTGACLAAALAGGRVARWPSLVVDRVSYGAGTKTWPDRPNLLRVVAGTAAGEVKGRGA